MNINIMTIDKPDVFLRADMFDGKPIKPIGNIH